MCIYAEIVECIQTGVSEHHARAGVYVRQAFWASEYTSAYTLAAGFSHAFMYVQFVSFNIGE